MIGKRKGHLASNCKAGVSTIVAVTGWALSSAGANAAADQFDLTAPASIPFGASNARNTQLTPEVTKLLQDAETAMKAGNLNLALIQLKNAVRLAPNNGEARARLGIAVLQTGAVVAAERELRQALSDKAPTDLAVPPLLRAMLQRNEIKELLVQFPDPPQGTQDKAAPDILTARAISLQTSGRPLDARVAMDRSLGLRRDAIGLVMSARLAQQQGNLTLARGQIEEALKLSPLDEGALLSQVAIARASGDMQKALADVDEFIERAPKSILAKVTRIELLLDSKQDAKAKPEVDALLKQSPNLAYGRYFRAVLMARAKDTKGAWREMQSLPPEFVQSQSSIARMVASVAAASENAESGGAVLTALIAREPANREARLQLASIRLSQNSPQAAIDVLAPLKGSNDAVVHALLAQAYLRQKMFNEALASLSIAASAPEASELLKRQLALSQLVVGDADNAIQGLRDLVQRDPDNAEGAAPLIAALAKASRWNEALAVTDGLAKRLPKSPLPEFYRGQVLVARGNLPEAQSAFDKALTLDPKFVPALYFRAGVSSARGNRDEAKKDLQLVLAQNPTNTLAYIQLSQLALDAGQDQEALAVLNRAIKAAPKDPVPRLALANYLIRFGKQEDAQATITELLLVSRNNPEGLALQGQIQFSRGQVAEAVKTFRALAAGNASSSSAYDLLARALYATKDQFGAENAAKRAIELDPSSVQPRTDLVTIQMGTGKGENALATARTYASAYPGPAADLLLADTLIALKRTDEAEALLDKSLASKPDPRLAVSVSRLAITSGNSKKAISTLATWLAKKPDDFAVRREYAALVMGSGDLAGARKEYETLLKQHPEDPIVLNNLGYLLQKNDPGRAFTLVSLAERIAPQSPQIADTLGWIKYQRKDHQGALPLLQRAHSTDADNPAIAYHLALVLDATGKRAEAKTLLQGTLAKNPKFEGSDDAKQTLARW